jgi:hypothetical protein
MRNWSIMENVERVVGARLDGKEKNFFQCGHQLPQGVFAYQYVALNSQRTRVDVFADIFSSVLKLRCTNSLFYSVNLRFGLSPRN